jgi:phosphoribosylamine--glycine ligase
MSVRRVLVVGSGGREHAIAWALRRDPSPPEVIVAPGNPGVATSFPCVALDPADPAAVSAAAKQYAADLVVVGPEAPLAAGVADALATSGVTAFGASRDAARLESSKWFAKEILSEAGVPTARAERFEDVGAARAALDRFGPTWVIKADGLAAGKGVRVTSDRSEAEEFLEDSLSGRRFGAGGRQVVLEEFLEGEEASVMAVCDGTRSLLLPAARDYKRAFDGDRGPNTGGMGAFAPHPAVPGAVEEEVERRIVRPVLARMRERGTPFRGLLYCGLMLGPSGPKVVEFNVRFGDPECQAVLPLLDGSLSELLRSAASGTLEPARVWRTAGAAVVVTIADTNYPESSSGLGVVRGLEKLSTLGVEVFHAATGPTPDGWRVTGGRAAYVMARGADVAEAHDTAYAAVGALSGSGWRVRSDVAAGVRAAAGARRGD